MAPEPRAAYVHIPFCRHHCGYCNFTVIAGRDELADNYLDALQQELEYHARHAGTGLLVVDSLYVGGGTPTRLTPHQLERLSAIVDAWFPRADNSEYTMEANPSDVDAGRLGVLTAAGVNRVSLGAQSFYDSKLRALDRDHTVSDVRRAYDLLRRVIPQVSLDLIFAAPEETLSDWQADLGEAIKLEPDHISVYGLTFEKGTSFWSQLQKNELRELDDELQRDMYLSSIDQLGTAGYEHYEVSNFAKPGYRSRHNENYWLGGRYAGIGAGASRFIGHERATNHRSTTTYMRHVFAGEDPTADREVLSAELQARERVVFGLRRRDGIDMKQIARETGVAIAELVGDTLARYESWGYLTRDGSRYRLTDEGLLISDSLWPDLL